MLNATRAGKGTSTRMCCIHAPGMQSIGRRETTTFGHFLKPVRAPCPVQAGSAAHVSCNLHCYSMNQNGPVPTSWILVRHEVDWHRRPCWQRKRRGR